MVLYARNLAHGVGEKFICARKRNKFVAGQFSFKEKERAGGRQIYDTRGAPYQPGQHVAGAFRRAVDDADACSGDAAALSFISVSDSDEDDDSFGGIATRFLKTIPGGEWSRFLPGDAVPPIPCKSAQSLRRNRVRFGLWVGCCDEFGD